MSWEWRRYYPPSRPRKVAGGLKLRSQRGEVAGTWWGRRWTEALASFGWHTRLERGRRYARAGQVASVTIEPGKVSALVQGSRPKPYQVTIALRAFSRAEWGRVADALARQALHAARLLAGEMPRELEGVFAEAKLPLFPGSGHDLSTDCSCPDDANPCKHIAAVHYILAQEFDRDPFLLFKLRGNSREELLGELRARRQGAPPAGEPNTRKEARPANGRRRGERRDAGPSADISKRLDRFFALGKELPARPWAGAALDRLPPPGAKLRELGTPAFWSGELDFEETLGRSYLLARVRALELARGGGR